MAEGVLVDPVNVSMIVQKIVREKLATYHELSTIYSLEDALDLLEIHEVGRYNNQKLDEVREAIRGNK